MNLSVLIHFKDGKSKVFCGITAITKISSECDGHGGFIRFTDDGRNWEEFSMSDIEYFTCKVTGNEVTE